MSNLIGDRVKKLRQEKKMSLSELALQAGVAKSYLSSLERNLQTNPSIQFLEKISTVLGVPVDSLILEHRNKEDLDSEWMKIVKKLWNLVYLKNNFVNFLNLINGVEIRKININLTQLYLFFKVRITKYNFYLLHSLYLLKKSWSLQGEI